jgi:hypothetical protein
MILGSIDPEGYRPSSSEIGIESEMRAAIGRTMPPGLQQCGECAGTSTNVLSMERHS